MKVTRGIKSEAVSKRKKGGDEYFMPNVLDFDEAFTQEFGQEQS